MAKSWIYRSCIALALACCSVFASAYEYVAPAARYIAYAISTGVGEGLTKFEAELAANYGDRTCEAGRANGLVKESNGFRLASLTSRHGSAPDEVGWRYA